MKTQKRSAFLTTALVMIAVTIGWVRPYPALAKTSASSLDGHVLNVGSGKPNGTLYLSGKARAAASDMDLSAAQLHVISFLSERKGSLELMAAGGGKPLLPLHLSAKKGGSATKAVFESEPSPAGPNVRITIARSELNTDEYDFGIQVERALIAADPACEGPAGTTERRSRLSLSDGVHAPVRLHVRHNWQCGKNMLTNPAPVSDIPPGEDATTPEGLVVNMALDLAKSVAEDQLKDALFPASSIDYKTLIADFEEVVKEALAEEKIQADEASINGFLSFLYDEEYEYKHGRTACAVLNDMAGQLEHIENFVAQLQSDGPAALSGWVSGAQTLLNTLQFLQALNDDLPINTPCPPYVAGDLSNNALLAAKLDQYIQYLVEQRNAILHHNILDSLHYCYNENEHEPGTSPSWEYKNCTGYTHGPWASFVSCENDALLNESISCAYTTFDDQTNENNGSDGNVAWMDNVIDSWRNALAGLASQDAQGNPQLPSNALPCATCQDADAAITVDKMMTGVNVAVPVETTWWVKAACDGKQSCDYQLEPVSFLQGDAYGYESTDALQSMAVTYHCGDDTAPRTASLAYTGSQIQPLYKGAYLHLDCAPAVKNFSASLQSKPLAVGVSDADVSTHKSLDAGKITDGITAEAGHSGADTSYVIILPHTQSAGALVIDLGAIVHVCGNGFDCLSGPSIQADNDDVYQLDYSSDGVNWTSYGHFPSVSGSGLRTRGIATITSGAHNPNFTARFVRVYGSSGGNTFSVSELTLWNTGSQLISVGKPASSNFVPLIANGQFAPEGTSWNNSTYATVLQNVGPAYGSAIDLGRIYGALDRVKIQADKNAYQIDVSTDGTAWFNWYAVPPVSATGLQTRDSGPLRPSAGRYVRVYATRGDGNYSVSEMQVFSNQDIPACTGERICGISAATVLAGNPGAAAQDVSVNWTCGNDTAAYTMPGASWTVSRSNISYPDSAVVQPYCPPTTVVCTDSTSNPTTCSHFAEDAEDDVVYMNAANIPFQFSNDFASCSTVISGKTNFYRTNSSTKNDPACTNVQRAIHDAIAEGSCPLGIGGDNQGLTWPYNAGIGAGSPATSLIDPAIGQPPLLLFLGCNSLLP